MSSLGPIQYEEPEGSVFLGRDYTKSKFTSDALSNEIDTEVRKIITSAQKEAKKIIEDNKKLQAEYRKLKASIEASSDGNSGNGQMNNSDLLRRLSNLEKIVYGRE